MKKILSLVLVLSMVLGSFGFAFANEVEPTPGEVLEAMGLLEGDGNGDLMLEDNLLRQQMIVMVARLLGQEEEAVNFALETSYEDVRGDYYKAVIGWAEANGYTDGIGAGQFGFDQELTVEQTIVFLLRVLGYEKDLAWENRVELAEELGFVAPDFKEVAPRGLMADLTVQALYMPILDGEVSLGTSLGLEGYEGEVTPEELEVVSVNAINVDEIEVVFNRAVEEELAIELKRGLVPYTTENTWNEEGTSVVLKAQFALPAGDYTVAVEGFEAVTVKLEAQKATSLSIDSMGIENKAAAAFDVTLLNQYGKKMTLNAAEFTITAFNATKGIAVAQGAGFTLDLGTPNEVNNTVVVTLVHNTGLTATKNLTIIAENAASTFGFEQVVIPTDQTRVYETNAAVEIKYNLVNQYGQSMKLPQTAAPAANNTIGGVLFTSTDVAVVNPNTLAVDANGKLTFTAGTKGKATLTAVVISTGAASTIQVEIVATETVDSFTIAAPAALITAKENVVLPYVALDQFGAQIAQKDVNTAIATIVPPATAPRLTFSSSNTAVINPATDISFNSKKELVLNATGDGSATVYVYLDGKLQNSVTFTVQEEAVATRITGVKNLPTLFENSTSAVKAFGYANLVVVDQYNRPFTLTNEQVNVVGATQTTPVLTASAANFTTGTIDFAGTANIGTRAFTISLDGVTGSQFVVTLGTVETKNIVSYELSNPTTLLANGVAGKVLAHNKTVTLTGKTANGTSVVLVPGKVTHTTSTDTGIATMDNALLVTGVAKGNATLAAWNGATKLAEITVEVTDVAPAASTIKFEEATLTLDNMTAAQALTAIKAELEVKDQYGVVITPVGGGTGFWTSNKAEIAFTADAITTYGNATDVTIGFVTNNGLVATVVVTVTNAQ